MTVKLPPELHKKRGPPKGTRPSGRRKGSRNKAVIERERAAEQARKRIEEIEQLRKGGVSESDAVALTSGRKLMKEIAFEFAVMFAGLAAFYQPAFRPKKDATGQIIYDRTGRPVMEISNPNWEEKKFKEYARMATDVALGAAVYESPKLAAVMLQSGMVTSIEVSGGLPDEEDGGFHASDNRATIDLTAAVVGEPGAAGAGDTATGTGEGAGQPADLSPGPSKAVQSSGEAQGGPVRKAVG